MKINFKRLLSMLLAFMMVVASFSFTVSVGAADYADVSTVASAVISEIKVNELLDYEVGEDIVFKFQIKEKNATTGAILSNVVTAPYLYYSAVMDDGRTLTGYVEPVDGAYTVTLEGGLLRPGFVWMTVKAVDSSKSAISTVTSLSCGAGADVTDILPIYGRPDEYSQYGDFKAFWDETLGQLDAEGGEATIQYIYDCGDYTFSGVTYDCYELEINCPKDSYYDSVNGNWCGTNHVFAYLTIPQNKTDLGFLLKYQGYDWILTAGSSYTNITPTSGICNSDKITLSVSPHSIPAPHNVAGETNADYLTTDENGVSCYKGTYYTSTLKSLYGYTSTHGKNAAENASPYTTYFKYMLMRDVQALNFLKLYFGNTAVDGYESWAGLWDGANVKTTGSSQGGYQALAVAGLCNDVVNEAYAGVPWFADQGVVTADSSRYHPSNIRSGYGEGLHYVDTAHLASLIDPDCDVDIIIGINDSHVPPATALSIYNSLRCNVSLTACQSQGHGPSISKAPYYQIIEKTSDTASTDHVVNVKTDIDSTLLADFEAAWQKVCGDRGSTVEIYSVDKNTDIDFAALASSSTADAIGVILTGDGLTNINAKLAEIYALHNDVDSKVWVIGNDETTSGKDIAITLDACMNNGDRATGTGHIKLYTSEGELGQTSILGANVPYAVIPSPLWVSAQGILVEAENVTLENGLLSTSVDEASVTFSAPAYTATYEMTGVGDAADYGNIEGVGLWIVGNDGTLTIKGAGVIPDYASYSEAPWASHTISSIDISEGITEIGTYAFADNAAEVNIPLSVTAIEVSAINAGATIVSYDNAYAKTFATENGITFENLGAIGTCGTDLTWNLDVDTGVLTIDGTGTTIVAGPTGYNTQSKSVWYDYYSKINKVVIGESVTTISKYSFTAMTALATVEVTKNLTTINDGAFQNSKKLKTIYIKGNTPVEGTWDLSSVTSLSGSYQFDGAGKESGYDTIILGDNLTGALGAKLFSYDTVNKKLTSLTIPAGVTSVSNRSFYNLDGLEELTFLNANTTIPADLLTYDNNTTTLSVINGRENSTAQEFAEANNITFNVIEEVVAQGKAGEDLYWKIKDEDGEHVMYIYGTGTYIQPYIKETGAFDTSISWNENHSQYDWGTYSGNVKKIVIEAPVTKVLGYTFASFDTAHTLELPVSMTALQSGSCFNDMDKLTTVYTTGQTPVEGTANLSNISSISDYAFVKSAFKNVIFKENVAIGSQSFRWTVALETLELPEGVTIGSRAFGGYVSSSKNKLTTVSFPESLATIPYSCFAISDAANGPYSANPYVTTMTIKNTEAVFEGATDDAPYTAFLDNFTALTTIYGYGGSTAEAMVTWANENTDRELTFVDLKGNTVASGSYSGATWTITKEANGEYTVTIGGDVTSIPAASSDWGWDDYKASVTKAVITAPITSLNTAVKSTFTNLEILELPVSCVKLEGSALNMSENSNLHTVYTTGQEMVEGTFNLTNIAHIGSYCMVFNKMDTLILGENVTVSSHALYWTPNLKTLVLAEGITMGKSSFVSGNSVNTRRWDVTSIEFPESMTVIPAESFNRNQGTADTSIQNNDTVTEITVNNPNALFAGVNKATVTEENTLAYHNEQFVTKMEALTTVKGHAGSTAEEFVIWANAYFAENEIDRTMTFVATDTVVSDMPMGDDIYWRLVQNEDGTTYTMDIYGSGTTMIPYKADGTAFDESARGSYGEFVSNAAYKNTNYFSYAGSVTKLRFFAPNLTKFWGYAFQGMAIATVELDPNYTSISNICAFNGAYSIDTVYTRGTTPVEGVADLSKLTTLASYMFVDCQFTKIILGEGLTTIPGYCFGAQKTGVSKLEVIEMPSTLTTVQSNAFRNCDKLVYILCRSDGFTADNSFLNMAARATVIAASGTAAETFASTNSLQFIDISSASQIDYYYYVDNSVLLLAKNGDKYTAFATGSDTKFELGYNSYDNAVSSKTGNGSNRVWNDYKTLITKVVYVNPALTYTDASFATHTAITTIEAPASLTTFGSNAYNGCKAFKTFHVIGTEYREGVADFSNITDLGSMGIASCAASTILLNDDYSKNLGDNLFFQCPNLTYIRIPAGVTALTGKTFNGSKKLTTVLFENPDTTIGSSSFVNCTGLTTFIGYKPSEAETYAADNSLEFIPIDSENVLTFDGFQIRESDYNGLRSIFKVNVTEMNSRATSGLKVVEYGSMLASTDKLSAASAELVLTKNSDGKYVSHDFVKVVTVYNDGELVGKIVDETDVEIEYACTVTNFTADNYTKNVTFRGYIVYADKEGNEYVVYADLADSDGSYTDENGVSYNISNLEAMCENMIADGKDLSTNICWLDILRFREGSASAS